MKRLLRYSVVALALAIFLITPANAYNLLGTKLDKNNAFEMYLHEDYNQLPDKYISQLAQASSDWDNIDKKVSLITLKNAKTRPSYGKLDNINAITIEADRYNQYLGQAAIWSQDGKVVEADLNINAFYNWSTDLNNANSHHFYSTVLHEMGHIVGLDHTDQSDSCMRVTLKTGESFAIGDVDRNGFKAIYSRTTTNLMPEKNSPKKTRPHLEYYSLLPTISLKNLVDCSNFIVEGQVIRRADTVTVECADGNLTKKFAVLTLRVDKVLQNEIQDENKVISIRVPVESLNEYKTGGKQLFFLLKPLTGGQFISECDFYTLPQHENSIFDITESGKYKNSSASYTKDEVKKAITEQEFTAIEFSNHQLKANYESGFLSESLYNQILENDKKYASVIEGNCGCMCTLATPVTDSKSAESYKEYLELTQNTDAEKHLKNLFENYFTNQIQAVTIVNNHHEGNVEIRLGEFENYDNLVVYSYCGVKNVYNRLDSKVSKGKDKYISFEITPTPNYIISDGTLDPKSSADSQV